MKTLSTLLLLFIIVCLTGCKKDVESVQKDVLTVTDIDGNVYNTVTIGAQVWMKENLKVTKYRNGNPIENSESRIVSTGAYSNYNNDANNSTIYGRLYNWPALIDNRNIAPIGWHVPSDDEWTTLNNYLGGMYEAGGKLKEIGFTVIPGGYRNYLGSFFYLGVVDSWWSTTEYSTQIEALARNYDNRSKGLDRGVYNKLACISVRCIKD